MLPESSWAVRNLCREKPVPPVFFTVVDCVRRFAVARRSDAHVERRLSVAIKQPKAGLSFPSVLDRLLVHNLGLR